MTYAEVLLRSSADQPEATIAEIFEGMELEEFEEMTPFAGNELSLELAAAATAFAVIACSAAF